jgi:heme iron utilization protein
MLFALAMTILAAAPDPVYSLLQEVKIATLCTNHEGTPFGSLVAYGLDSQGRPYVFISDLAEHTENIKKSKKVSLMIFKEDKEDLFNSQRVTFVGKMILVEKDHEIETLKKDYLKRFPPAEQFIDFGDFNFYRLETEKIHCIGGFGDIEWTTPEEWGKIWKEAQGKNE